MRSFFLVQVFVTASIINFTASAQIPEKYIGVWYGSAVQQNPSSTWTISILINEDNSRVAYPSLSCGGTLTLISASEEELVFAENITYGTSRCIIQTTVTLRMQEGDQNQLIYTVTAGATFANGSVSRAQDDLAWSDLIPLQEDYESKVGTNEAPYANFFQCLSSLACQEFLQNGANGWANGFVQHLFIYQATHNDGNKGSNVDCLEVLPNEICFAVAGGWHFYKELAPGFTSYCKLAQTEEDFDRWDFDHDRFLTNATLPCGLKVIDDSEVGFLAGLFGTLEVIGQAVLLRETVQAACNLVSAFPNKSVKNKIDLPAALSRDELYSQTLDSLSSLAVSAIGDTFFLGVGSTMQLRVVKKDSSSGVVDLTLSDTGSEYFLAVADSIATISEDGLLTVNGTPGPLSNDRPLLQVVVKNGEDIGIGQFAIVDADTDGDFIVDSHEERLGLNPEFPNSDGADVDRDGLPDLFEVLLGTWPTRVDSDGDGLSDEFEYFSETDALDPKKPTFTSTNRSHEERVSLESFRIRSVYPLPTHDRLLIQVDVDQVQKMRLEIFDVLSREVYKEELGVVATGSQNYSLDLSYLGAGVYSLRVTGEGGMSAMRSVIVAN